MMLYCFVITINCVHVIFCVNIRLQRIYKNRVDNKAYCVGIELYRVDIQLNCININLYRAGVGKLRNC